MPDGLRSYRSTNSTQSTIKEEIIRTLTPSYACLSLSGKDTPPRTPSIPIPNMNSDFYNGYLDYLSNLNTAESLDVNWRRKIEKTAINYFISNNILYRRHYGKNRLVVPDHKK